MTRTGRRILPITATAAGLGAAVGAYWAIAADSGAGIAAGRVLYAEHCASCHGADLEGQPNWRERLPDGRMPAPPHDASGHTWHHSDDLLFRIVEDGVSAVLPGYESDMPAFGGVLSEEEIRGVLAFIGSTWPERERNYHEARSQAAR